MLFKVGRTEVSAIVEMSEPMVRHHSRDVDKRRLARSGMKTPEETWQATCANLFGRRDGPVHRPLSTVVRMDTVALNVDTTVIWTLARPWCLTAKIR